MKSCVLINDRVRKGQQNQKQVTAHFYCYFHVRVIVVLVDDVGG